MPGWVLVWIGISFLIALTILVTRVVERQYSTWKRNRMFARARHLEGDAVRVLKRKGFLVEDSQSCREVWVEVDGKKRTYTVKADYLAKDLEEALHVVEVKTGTKAIDPVYTDTRRQLLEYQLAYPEAEGVLLVNMEVESLQVIRFPSPAELKASLVRQGKT